MMHWTDCQGGMRVVENDTDGKILKPSGYFPLCSSYFLDCEDRNYIA
jgi:hypothetical protein